MLHIYIYIYIHIFICTPGICAQNKYTNFLKRFRNAPAIKCNSEGTLQQSCSFALGCCQANTQDKMLVESKARVHNFVHVPFQ